MTYRKIDTSKTVIPTNFIANAFVCPKYSTPTDTDINIDILLSAVVRPIPTFFVEYNIKIKLPANKTAIIAEGKIIFEE